MGIGCEYMYYNDEYNYVQTCWVGIIVMAQDVCSVLSGVCI